MRNRYLEKMNSIVKIKVVGSNIHNYLKRMMKNKIQMLRVIPVSRKEIHILLKYSEYQKMLQYRSIYEISVLQFYGKLRFREKLRKQFILFLFLTIGVVFIFFLSKVVFAVEVVHSDREIREFLKDELQKYGISKYSLKKSYFDLENIEDKILSENKDRLEWIEIVSYGTKYTVRVEERKLNQEEQKFQYQSIVSKKNAVLVEIDAIRGEKVKGVNDYVSKGDTIISGLITLPDNTKVPTQAEGKVLGEVWYTVNIDYPFVYQETNFTGRMKTVYAIYFFDKRLGFFDFEKYRSFQSKEKILISSNFLDIRFVKEKQYEVIVKDEVYTEDLVESRAIQYMKDKMMKDNPSIQDVKDIKIMNSFSNEEGIRFKMFVRTVEEIGEIQALEEEKLQQEENT